MAVKKNARKKSNSRARKPAKVTRKKPISRSRALGSSYPKKASRTRYKRRSKRLGASMTNTFKDFAVALLAGLIGGGGMRITANAVDKIKPLPVYARALIDVGAVTAPLAISAYKKSWAKYLVPISVGYGVLAGASWINQFILKDGALLMGRGVEYQRPVIGAGAQFREPVTAAKVAGGAQFKKVPMGASAATTNKKFTGLKSRFAA